MAPTVRCRVEAARVRSEKSEALTALIHQLFNRRHLSYVASNERAWLTAELVQSLRRQSEVYKAMSTKTSGPLPFALGYFRVQEGRLEPVSDPLPIEEPEVLVRLLSEYLQPGAQLYFEADDETVGWQIHGMDAVERLEGRMQITRESTSAASDDE